MSQISVRVQNILGVQYNVTVYDQYGGGQIPVAGSPFKLAPQQPSSPFSVGADPRRNGVIGYSCDAGGPSLNGVRVREGDTVKI